MLKRIFKTSFYSLCSRGFLTLTNLSIIFAVSKFLKSSELGIYAITFFFYYLASVLSSLGLQIFFSREIAYRREDEEFKERVLGEIFTSFMIGTILCSFIVVFTLLFYSKIELPLLIPVVVSGLFLGVERNLSGILLGEERMDIETIYRIINLIIVAGLTILYVKIIGILGVYLLRMGASLLTIVLRLIYLNKRSYKIKLKYKKIKSKEKGFFFATDLLYFILRQIDVFILSLIITKELLGAYFLALRIYYAFGLFADIVSVSLTPIISRTYRGKEKNGFSVFFRKALKYFAVSSLVFSLSLFFSRNLIVSFFSEGFVNTTGKYLMYFSFMLIIKFLYSYSGNMLTATEYQNKRFYILLNSSIILILLNIMLGSLYEVYGIITSRAAVELYLFIAYGVTMINLGKKTKNEKN